MSPKILTFVGLGFTIIGTVVSAIATNQTQQLQINRAVNAEISKALGK